MAYIPDILPYDIKLFPKYLNNELLKIEESLISQKDLLSLSTTNVAPSKVDEGDIRFADGADWNPGAGAGIYAYHSGAWNKLG